MATEEWKAWQARATAAEAALATQGQRAAEATARVEALTAEVRDHEWRENGAKMKGES